MFKYKIILFIKFILIKFLKLLPNVFQLFPYEILRVNRIEINQVKIIYEPLSQLSQRRWNAFERNGKEKNTFDWINSFKENKVFFDIGANIGVFSIYSALKKNSQVYAFEPEPNSFIELFKTIELNNCNVTPMLIPLNNLNEVNFFNLKNEFTPGKSGHNFGNRDIKKKNFGMTGFKLDDMVFNQKIPIPDYIKIDVDGLEDNVLDGMKKVLDHDKLSSILIEFSDEKQVIFYEEKFKKNNLKLVGFPTGKNRNYIFSRKH